MSPRPENKTMRAPIIRAYVTPNTIQIEGPPPYPELPQAPQHSSSTSGSPRINSSANVLLQFEELSKKPKTSLQGESPNVSR